MSQTLPLHTPQLSPDARAYLCAVHLDWFNHYLTVEKFAEHNGITPGQAWTLIALANEVYNSQHPEA